MNAKSIIKKIALALAGVAALTAVGFGVKAIVDYTKNDLKTISPGFEVGNLGSDGKFVDDKSTLYTKEAFGCYGLQVKPNFDSTVNYQIFYYDILDNYISSTSVLSEGYSGEAPLNGAYARMVIEPKDDEDGKISLTERSKYPNQFTIKVNKKQDINERFVVLDGKVMQVVYNVSDLIFEDNLGLSDDLFWVQHNSVATTSAVFLKVDGGSTLHFEDNLEDSKTTHLEKNVFEFSAVPSRESLVANTKFDSELVLNKRTKYILINVYRNYAWDEAGLKKLPSCFSITKSK